MENVDVSFKVMSTNLVEVWVGFKLPGGIRFGKTVSTPKDKPYVDRMIGTLERECIQWGGLVTGLTEQQAIIDQWLEEYHSYRPHQALGYLTPNEYTAKLEAEVSTM